MSINPERIATKMKEINDLRQAGNSIKIACEKAKVGIATYYKWVKLPESSVKVIEYETKAKRSVKPAKYVKSNVGNVTLVIGTPVQVADFYRSFGGAQ